MTIELLRSIDFRIWIAALIGALLLIGAILYWLRQKRVPRIAKPYRDSHFVTVDGYQYHFRQAGQGKDLVLLHGIGASVYIWRFLFESLATHYRVTAIDILGFGDSEKPVGANLGLDPQTERLHRLMSVLRIHRPMLIGSSMGGTLALWLLHRHPQIYFGAVVIAPATNPKLVKPQHKALIPVGKRLYKSLNPIVMGWILRMVVSDKGLITSESVAAYLRPYQDDGEAVACFFAAVDVLTDPRLPRDLHDIELPVHIIWGQKDKLVRRKTMEELRRTLPNCSWSENAHAGHHLMEDHPDWSLQEIQGFLTQTSFEA